MHNKQRINVSGYRGIWGESLNKEVVVLYIRAFVSFLKKKTDKPTILIGRDGRESGPLIKEIILSELRNLGVEGIDGDILPTPTVLFSVNKHNYTGGIIITASHNPIEYNGLKFVNEKGLFTIKEEVDQINKYYEEEIEKYNKGESPIISNTEVVIQNIIPNFLHEHADKIVENVNRDAIRAKKFRVAVDMINASACVMDPYLFECLGVEVVPLNNIPNGKFGHRPEPLRENLTDISKLAKESKTDLGFVHDPDADRLVLVDENGDVVLEEYSVALAVENVLSKNPGKNIVVNLSTSQMNREIAHKYGGECFFTKIGEGFVVEGMMKHDAIIGGEGNGGIIYPKIHPCRDSFTGLSLILELLAERNKTIGECIKEIPKYYIKKDKWPVGENLNEMYSKMKSHFGNAKFDEQDGLRLDLEDSSWLQLRPSNTEPIIKLFGEAKTQERIDELFEETKKILF